MAEERFGGQLNPKNIEEGWYDIIEYLSADEKYFWSDRAKRWLPTETFEKINE